MRLINCKITVELQEVGEGAVFHELKTLEGQSRFLNIREVNAGDEASRQMTSLVHSIQTSMHMLSIKENK